MRKARRNSGFFIFAKLGNIREFLPQFHDVILPELSKTNAANHADFFKQN